ncbi:MAG: hypothetical protein ACK4TP_17415 [Hyphomicrobium sp.]
MSEAKVRVGGTVVTVAGERIFIDVRQGHVSDVALTPEQQQTAARLHEENEWREGRGPKPTWWDDRFNGEGEEA